MSVPGRGLHDFTRGPAKWAAVVVLAAGAGTAGYFASKRSAPMLRSSQESVPISTPARDERTDEPAGEPPAQSERKLVSELPIERASSASASTKPALATRININTATAAELDLLPGIGPALAKRIVEDREKNGRFVRVDDIVRVKGIGPKTLEKLRALIAVE